MPELGSDAQMTDAQRDAMNRRLEVEEAEVLEEDRKTAAAPAEDGHPERET